MLALVAPTSMTTDQQELWLRAAADALEDIRPQEVAAISAEVRRSVTRPNQIVPEIAKLVHERRRRSVGSHDPESPSAREFEIDREARDRRAKARNQAEIDATWEWERQARSDAGLYVPPRPALLNAVEIGRPSPDLVKMGLKCGALEYREGRLVDSAR